jgi:hypothetical protein
MPSLGVVNFRDDPIWGDHRKATDMIANRGIRPILLKSEESSTLDNSIAYHGNQGARVIYGIDIAFGGLDLRGWYTA